jgi:hypothetical protein
MKLAVIKEECDFGIDALREIQPVRLVFRRSKYQLGRVNVSWIDVNSPGRRRTTAIRK